MPPYSDEAEGDGPFFDEDDPHVPLMSAFDRQNDADSLGGGSGSYEATIGPAIGALQTPGEESDAPLRFGTSSATQASLEPSEPAETAEAIDIERHGAAGASTPPRFIEENTTRSRWWRWIPYPARRLARRSARWMRGPDSPHRYTIRPLFPVVQEYPLRLADRFAPKRGTRAIATFALFAVWLVIFALVKSREDSRIEIRDWGVPTDIGCGATYWSAGNGCGLDGDDCRPFEAAGFPFRCPAGCASFLALNPHAVGTEELNYRPVVVGGPASDANLSDAFYRGDSYLCAAAIHAGVATNGLGGCGVVELVGQRQGFVGSLRHGISSVGFDTYFPLTFQFATEVQCGATTDSRWILLGVTVAFTSVLSLFSASPALFFFPTFTMVFWEVGLGTDPPTHSSAADLVSTLLGRFLPAMFCAWVIYDRMGVRRTLDGLTAQVEKTVLWLGGCWVSALDDYTWSRMIPIQRLNKHDLDQQPGARAALAIILAVLLAVVCSQVWFFRQEGRLVRKLRLYGLLLAGVLLSLALPGLSLRIHHYILALLLLPGTGMQTRPSLLYQGLLVGWFINGTARWGFDAVLQTALALQGDAQLGSALPNIPIPDIALAVTAASAVATAASAVATAAAAAAANATDSITFTWGTVPASGTYDGISILVNDVERFRGYFAEGVADWTWRRESRLGLNEYFRFGYMSGSSSQDYTQAGTWTGDGKWVDMLPGPSKM